MAYEILKISMLSLIFLTTITLFLFLIFIDFAFVPEVYRKMMRNWFIAMLSVPLHLLAHITEFLLGERILYSAINFIATLVFFSAIVIITKDVYRAIIFVERGKNLEKEVEKKTRHIKALMENSPDLILTLDNKLRITYANKRINELAKYDAKSVLGKRIMIADAEKITKGRGEFETLLIPKEGKSKHVIVSYVFLEDYDEYIVFIKDIEKIKEYEKELKRRVNELEVFMKAEVDRELKIIELKNRIKELERKLEEYKTKSGINNPEHSI